MEESILRRYIPFVKEKILDLQTQSILDGNYISNWLNPIWREEEQQEIYPCISNNLLI